MFHSNFASYFKSNGDTVLGRDLINDDIYTCWQSDTSSTIVLGSSASLSKNVIVNSPVTSIISSSEKLGIEYSILVRQYALTSDAYQFYVNIKKNTEQLGSIFDALPSQINGNLHSVTNPGEPVIGFVSVGSISTKRIFITNRQLPNWATTPFYSTSVCRLEFETMPCCFYGPPDGSDNEVDFYINYNKGGSTSPLIPIDAIGVPGHPPIGYTATTKECTDCTLRGTNKKSLFWQ